jgi:hypothetical protein
MLEPVDRKRCQAEQIVYRPFIMGGNVNQRIRCSNKPKYVAEEAEPDANGERGAMSLCLQCRKELIKQFTKNEKPVPTFKRIR